MTRIEKRFGQLKSAGRGAFIPYVTAGDPDLETTRKIVLALASVGADVIELGVPFSDPIADGPVIQRATERALHNRVRLRDVLRLGADIRRESDVPLLLFSYYNPLLRYGLEALARDAAAAGFDGVLATDLTVEESGEFCAIAKAAGLNTVFLAAPTSSPERIRKIASVSTGFLYAVSRTGVTGERDELATDLHDFLSALRRHTSTPIAVGFGVSTPGHVQAIWRQAEGAVVGSTIVAEIEKNLGQPDIAERIRALAAWAEGRCLTMNIDDWRQRIDAIDRKLVELFNERSRCAIEIGKIKRTRNMEVIDAARERDVIRRALEENQGPLGEDALRRLFERVMEECRSIE